jgi:hypothetical protein
MIDDLFTLSQSFLRLRGRSFQRYFLKRHPLSTRFSLIVGQRGASIKPLALGPSYSSPFF